MKLVRDVIALVLLVGLLGGCAATNVSKEYALEEAKGSGLMVVSLTRSGISGFSMFADVRSVDNKYKNSVPITDLLASSDWGCPLFGKIPEDPPCGRLAIVEMPEGEYEFYSWHGSSGGAPGTVRITVQAKQEFSKRFKITAGKAVYIGNIHFLLEAEYTKGPLGIPVPIYLFNIKTKDMRERDLVLLYSKNPKITSENVLSHVLQ